MDIPRRKYLWSYITPVILEETASEQNPYLAVALSKGRLQLLAGKAIYSWDDLYDNFYHAFGKLGISKTTLQDALILGGGLGSIPFMLEKRFRQKHCRFTIVEYDPTINALAQRYTQPRLKNELQFITADAASFVNKNEQMFDLICVDVFDDDLVPAHFETPQFLRQCVSFLRKGGYLLFNRLYMDESDRKATDKYTENVFKAVLSEGTALATQGNKVLVWQKG